MGHAIEAIQRLTFHLPPTINGFRGKVCIPFNAIPLRDCMNYFTNGSSSSASIIAGFDEVSDVLFGVTLVVESLKLRWLLAFRHIPTGPLLHQQSSFEFAQLTSSLRMNPYLVCIHRQSARSD